VRVREAADKAMKRIVERRGLAKFMKLTQTQGAYASHPLGGCRMAASPDLGVVDHRGAVFGYEGLYCMDSSIIPTSLGVNPSLTIAAVAERCADHLVRAGGDLGLPRAEVSPSVP
jgi:cholesterol oxidase